MKAIIYELIFRGLRDKYGETQVIPMFNELNLGRVFDEYTKPERWITVKGHHIPIFKGQTEEQAINNCFNKLKQTGEASKPKRYLHYKPVRDIINKVKSYKGKPDGTYNMATGEPIEYKTGYCFSFHQNEPDENGNFKSAYGRYSPQEYDRIANEIAEKYDLPINIGVYGNPEVSSHTEDFNLAKELAKKYNQQSVYNCSTGDLWVNKQYNPKQNPIQWED